MNELHKQIRKDAEKLLGELMGKIRKDTFDVMKGHGFVMDDLLRLAIGGRTAALRKKVVGILAKEREQELLDLYQKKPELKAVGKE